MEAFVSELLENADLGVITKKDVRVKYKNFVGRDISSEEKAKINDLVYAFVFYYAAKQKKLEDSKQKSVGPSLPGDKENKLAHIKEKGMKNGKHVSSINSQVLKGQVSDKVNIKNLKRKHSLEREYTDREKNSTGPTRRKSYPMRQRKQLPGIRYDDAISAVIESASENSDSDPSESSDSDLELDEDEKEKIKLAVKKLQAERLIKIQLALARKKASLRKIGKECLVLKRINDVKNVAIKNSTPINSGSDESNLIIKIRPKNFYGIIPYCLSRRMTSKLTSLMKYRFVKKDSKSSSGSQSSDTETLSPSETSTQPPVTPNKSNGPGSQCTPDGKRSVSVEPDSPIFSSRSKLPGRSLIRSPSQPSSSTSSPWMSKENGTLQNGASSKKPKKYPLFSDDEEDVNHQLVSIPEYESKLNSLRQMFQARKEEDIREGLIDGNGDVENAIDIIIGLKSKKSFKRIRTDNHDSLSDPDTPVQPRKRIRQISSDSDEEMDSQTTVSYGLESQRSDATEIYDLTKDDAIDEPLSKANESKVKFLLSCFSDKSRQEIVRALSSNNWDTADASVAMSDTHSLKAVTTEQKIRTKERKAAKIVKEPINLDDDDDDDEEYGNDSDASEDSIEMREVVK